ncbi:MAG: AMP-binding protein [Microscillaceae bacterium]|nr:AMP-binding protein [Microscillaceae bacterium]
MSFSALEAQVNRFAHALASLGVQEGERVAILLPNIPQFVVCNYGILLYGAVGVMANPLYTERELEHLLNDAGAETLISLDILAPRVQAILPKTKLKRVIFTHLNDLIPLPEAMIPPGFFALCRTRRGCLPSKI